MKHNLKNGMKNLQTMHKTILSVSLATIFLVGCASAPKSPDGAANVRQQLTQLQADSQLSVLAPLAIKDAERAVVTAEQPEKDLALARHRVLMAERKVTLAQSEAQTRQLELQRTALSQRRDEVQLSARTREANMARSDADRARSQADIARDDARSARQRAETSEAAAADLRSEIAELNAKATDRGLVVTLGDLLFDTGQFSLRRGSNAHLDKLAQFLNTNAERTAMIEGHTDDVGSDSANMLLSQRRADTVKAFLVAQGVAASRLEANGKGEVLPITSNGSAEGRQQNRRVEVIIANTAN